MNDGCVTGFEHVRAKKPTDAARAIQEINQNTLISHENSNHPISRNAAEKYGAAFGVLPGWLLYGEVDAYDAYDALAHRITEVRLISRVTAGE